MARGEWWECPICRTPNPPEMAVCVNTAQHDAVTQTRAKAMRAAGQILADARARIARQTPLEAARAAEPTAGPERLDELADRIRLMRAEYRAAA